MISSLFLSLLLSGAQATPLTAGPSTDEVARSCFAAIEGDYGAGRVCLDALKPEADAMRVDMNASDFQSTCLVIPALGYHDLIDLYIEWLIEHQDSMDKPAKTTINAALLEKVPCGWRQR